MSANKRLRGVSVFRPIIYGNTAIIINPEDRGESDHTHRWTIAVRSATSPATLKKSPADTIGGGDDLSYFIKKVTFKLHETYPTSLRSIERPPFEVTETGWGEFDIIIKIFLVGEAAEKPMTFTHHLKLHPWPTEVPAPLSLLPAPVAAVIGSTTSATSTPEPVVGPPILLSPVHSWQYEEIIFAEPTETFYSLLLSRPPTPLPKSNRHPKNLQYALGGGGNMGEFTMDMEKEEGDRLDAAKKQTLGEIEGLRKRLIGNEKDLTALRKEVEDLSAAATPATTAVMVE